MSEKMAIDTPETTAPEIAAKARPSWGRVLVWAGLIALLSLLALGLLRTQQGSIGIGQRSPDFTLTTYDGEQISLHSLRGKVVLINFWASWCKPCEEEAADLETAWRYYQPGGQVVFLGVDWTDTEAAGKAYLQKFGITYPNGPDLGTRISQLYRITGVPETYILDQDGVVASAKISPYASVEEIQAAIDPLLEP
jgi:cytochrome c biogenesis protein CcmG/thiol:disulfide interchange protein DsbE